MRRITAKALMAAGRRNYTPTANNSNNALRRFANTTPTTAFVALSKRFHGHSHGDGTVCHHDHGHSHGNGEVCYHDHSHAHGHSHGDGNTCFHDHGHSHSHAHGHSHGNGEMCYHDHGHGHSHGMPAMDPAKTISEDHPLMVAAREGNAETIRAIFAAAKADGKPLDANSYMNYMITPLHEAADLGHTDACVALLENGASIDAQMQDGQTPLHVAAFNGHTETVSRLVELHADLDVRNELQYTALHSAIAKGHMDVITKLLDAGADINAACMDGLSGLQLAILFAATPNPNPISRNAPAGTNQTEVSSEQYTAVVKLLLEKGADITSQDEARRTALHTAAERNSYTHAKVLLDLIAAHPHPEAKQSLVNAQTIEGVTPMHIAAAHGNVPLVQLLVEHGASITIEAAQHTTPLHTAAGKGSVDVLKVLMAIRKAEAKDSWEQIIASGPESTAIHFAAQEGHLDAVKALIEAGANVKATIGSGDTPLHLAGSGGHADVCAYLLEKGADINAANSDGILPIHTCTSANNVEALKVFIANKADLNPSTQAGWAPLHVAASNGADDSVALIIETVKAQQGEEAVKAMVNAPLGNAKWTALHLAAQGNHANAVEHLLDSGANPNAHGANGLLAIHFAAQFDDINMLAQLIKAGADVSAADGNGRTPLHVAAMFEHPIITRKLLECGANTQLLVKGTDGDSYTALQIAASSGHAENVAILVTDGKADVNGRSVPGGKTALHVAALAGDLGITLKLLALGADATLISSDGKVAAELTADPQIIAALEKKQE